MKLVRSSSSWVMYLGMAACMYGGAQWPRPSWPLVAAGLVVILVGIALRRSAGAPTLEVEQIHSADLKRPRRTGSLVEALTSFCEGIETLHNQGSEAELAAIKDRIEELIWLGPERVGSSQEAIAAKVGFSAYAEVMAPLAASERWLNRAWSAAADGHRPECLASLAKALVSAREAEAMGRQRFQGLG
ncbi:MAG: hypothetical protein RMJ98_11315 [Myxococcales bacterium]|nr:hypothetical protein [Polyangiaceae bacterium]MDW8249876.1 hypothetical protein [Myxococcales bacterium]